MIQELKGRAVTEICGEWKSAEELKPAFEARAEDYNNNYLYSTLEYKTPERFEAEYKTSRAA